MKRKFTTLSRAVPATPRAVAAAARALRAGQIVAFPTETVYGLGANAFDEAAVARIFVAKGRPADNPLIVHVDGPAMLHGLVRRVSREALELMDRFWPGPLTLVFPKRPSVPDAVTAGLRTVAVRMPDHPVALALIRAAGVPIAAPSANRSGRPSPTDAAHVAEDFPGVLVLDGGRTAHGLESTVVALDGTPRVLRLGALTLEELRRAVPGLRGPRRHGQDRSPESPGLKYRHYAPTRPLVLFRPSRARELAEWAAREKGALVLCADASAAHFPPRRTIRLGGDAAAVARNLYEALRTRKRGTALLVLGFRKVGILRTVMDRLERAATTVV